MDEHLIPSNWVLVSEADRLRTLECIRVCESERRGAHRMRNVFTSRVDGMVGISEVDDEEVTLLREQGIRVVRVENPGATV